MKYANVNTNVNITMIFATFLTHFLIYTYILYIFISVYVYNDQSYVSYFCNKTASLPTNTIYMLQKT